MVAEERRRGERKIIPEAEVSLMPLDPRMFYKLGGRIEGDVHDLSLYGVGVDCYEELPQDTPVRMDLKVGDDLTDIRVFGRVIWIKPAKDKFLAGVSFSWWKDDVDKNIVNDFLEGKILKI